MRASDRRVVNWRLTPAVLAWLMVAALVAVVVPSAVAPSAAGAFPAGFSDSMVVEVDAPTDLAWTPDGRVLIPTKGGELFIMQNDALIATPALDLSPVMCTNGERALGGAAVHPNFAINRYVYLYYTFNKYGTCNESEVDGPVNRLSRFELPPSNIIDPATETVLFDTPPLFRDHHNSGDIEWGTDGTLFITVGDGGTRRFDWPQDPGRLYGKIVRINDDGSIPGDNPHTGADSARCNVDGVIPSGSAATKCQEVYSQGLRNPFRFAFDPNSPTTRFYVNDVGQSSWEEISEGPIPGGDYGWTTREGPCEFDSTTNCGPSPAGLTDPVHWYQHGVDGGAVTGGAFVPNGVWPAEYDGDYLYADYVFGKIYRLEPGAPPCLTCSPPTSGFTQTEFGDAGQVVEMAFGPHNGGQALYYVTRENDAVRRITFDGVANRNPTAVIGAAPTAGQLPLVVNFDGTGSTDPDNDPLTHAWDFDGNGSTDSILPAPSFTYATAGSFDATLTVDDGNGGSDTTSVQIDAGNSPPEPVMNTPVEGTEFFVGQVFNLSGSATDPEDGPLGDTDLTWEVRQWHNTHFHPLIDENTPGNNLQMIAPEPEDFQAATTSYLEVLLTATDSNGTSATVSRILNPSLVNVDLDTNPTGLDLVVDDFTITTPQTAVSWENHALRLEAPDQTDGGGTYWAWSSWDDGGAQNHTATLPAGPSSFTATFVESTPPIRTFNPTDDATIRSDKPDTNYGADPVVEGDSTPPRDGLFRFDVTGLDGQAVAAATLRLYVINSSDVGGSFSEAEANWSQDTVTWNTGPGLVGAPLADAGDVDLNTWVEMDVTSAVTGEGPVAFRFSSTSANGVDYASIEHPGGNIPELVVDLGDPPGPDTSPPTPPGSLVAQADTPTEIELDWVASTDNVGVVAYDIYRNGNFLVSVDGSTVAYEDKPLFPNGTYSYWVIARDAAGNWSAPSNTATDTTPPPDTIPPDPPATVTATATSANRVVVDWTPAVDNYEVIAYLIFRNPGWVVGGTFAPGTSFIDDTVAADSTYEYIVVPLDGAWNYSLSDRASVTTPPASSTITLTATDDAMVRESSPTANFGALDIVEVDAMSRKDGLFRFDVAGTSGSTVTSATLRMFVIDSSPVGGSAFATDATPWSEGLVTWSTAPAAVGPALDSLGQVNVGTWAEFDVTGAIGGDGPVSFRVTSTSSNGVDYASTENAGGNQPELVITID